MYRVGRTSSRSKGRDCNVQSYEDDAYGGYPEGTRTIKMPSRGTTFRAVRSDASGGHDDPKEAYRDRDAPSRVPREDIRKRTGWLPEAAASGGRFQSSDISCTRSATALLLSGTSLTSALRAFFFTVFAAVAAGSLRLRSATSTFGDALAADNATARVADRVVGIAQWRPILGTPSLCSLVMCIPNAIGLNAEFKSIRC